MPRPLPPSNPRRLAAAAGAFLVAVTVAAATGRAAAAPRPVPHTAAELFDTTAVWDFHLTFAADQWAAMEPKAGIGMLALMLGGRAAGPGPADLLAAALLERGDRGRDGTLDRAEATALADRWFGQWDRGRAGRLDADALRDGLDATLDPEGVAGGGAFPISLRGKEGARNGLAAAMGIEFRQVHAKVELPGAAFDDVAVRYKGNGTFVESAGVLKRSLKVDLNAFAKGQKLAGVAKLNLHSNVTDPTFMNEVLAHRLYRDAGVPAPRTAYARVYLTVPGKHDRRYVGIYSLVENVDDDFAKDRFGSKRGATFKPVAPTPFVDLGDDWAAYRQAYDPKGEPTAHQARRVMELARLVSHADDAAFAARVGDYLDLDAFARYMAVTTYLSAMDSILLVGQNYYVHLHPGTDKFVFVPWDLDHSFGQSFGNEGELADLSIRRPWAGPKRFLERVYGVEAFKALYLARLDEFARTIFRPERLQRQVDEVAAAVRPAIEEESKDKVERFDKSLKGEPIRTGLFSTRARTPIPRFAAARVRSVRDQVADKSQGRPPPGMGGFGGPGRQGTAGPGRSLAPGIMAATDDNRDGLLDRGEFVRGVARLFDAWDNGKAGTLTAAQVAAGVKATLLPKKPATAPVVPRT